MAVDVSALTSAPLTAPASPFLRIHGLSKQYGSARPVLQELNFTAVEGEFISLLGTSGCGKSTLLKVIAGLSPASSGSVRIDGRHPDAARDLMSFVFQDPTLLPWRTVTRNVELALEFEHVAKAARQARVESMLRLVGLSEARDYYPRQLSGGMKMRASIARALVTTPRLLLMDEPFGALDAMTRHRLNEELLLLKQAQHWTTLFVTHSIAEAVFLSDRIVLMAAQPGRIAEEIRVSLPTPRTAALRNDAAFLTLVGQVGKRLAAIGA
jgi:NitT/TauT family transport system ATP-binding protein